MGFLDGGDSKSSSASGTAATQTQLGNPTSFNISAGDDVGLKNSSINVDIVDAGLVAAGNNAINKAVDLVKQSIGSNDKKLTEVIGLSERGFNKNIGFANDVLRHGEREFNNTLGFAERGFNKNIGFAERTFMSALNAVKAQSATTAETFDKAVAHIAAAKDTDDQKVTEYLVIGGLSVAALFVYMAGK